MLTFPSLLDRLGSWKDGGSLSGWRIPGDHSRFLDGDTFQEVDFGVRGVSMATFTILDPLRVWTEVVSKMQVFVAEAAFLNFPIAWSGCNRGTIYCPYLKYPWTELGQTCVIHVYETHCTLRVMPVCRVSALCHSVPKLLRWTAGPFRSPLLY